MKCFGKAELIGYGTTDHKGDKENEMGPLLPYIDWGTGRSAAAITAGLHTCAILDDSSVKCFGENADGQLGTGDAENMGDDPDEMGINLDEVKLSGSAVDIATGGAHSCALLEG